MSIVETRADTVKSMKEQIREFLEKLSKEGFIRAPQFRKTRLAALYCV